MASSSETVGPHSASAKTTWVMLFSDGLAWRTFLVAGGAAANTLSTFIVGTVLPSLIGDLGGVALIAWVTAVYITAAICGTALGSWLITRFGARGGYAVALSMFLVGSAACAAAVSMPMLLVGRGLQGLGGGMITALAYGTIGRLYPEHLRPRAIVLISSVMGTAALVGPVVGSSVEALWSWRLAFLLDLPIGLFLLAIALRYLPPGQASATRNPVPLLRLLVLGLGAFAILASGTVHDPRAVGGGLACAAVAIAIVLTLDRRANVRLLPPGAYNPRYALGAISATMGLISGFPIAAVVTFLPFVLVNGFRFSAFIAGFALAIHAISWTLMSVATASRDAAARPLMAASPLLVVAGVAVLVASLSAGSIDGVLVSQALLGGGIGMAWAHMSALLMRSVDEAARPSAAAFIPMTQQLAMLFGSAIAGLVANAAGLPAARTVDEVSHAGILLFGIFLIFPLLAVFSSRRMLSLTAGR